MLRRIWGLQWMRSMGKWVGAIVLCLIVLFLDLWTPRGVAIGGAYIPLIFCALWFRRASTAFVFATASTILMISGFLAKSSGSSDLWIGLVNRGITISILWFVAVLVYNRRKSELTLKNSESKLSAVVDHALDGLISINEKGIVEDFNPACERIFGYQAKEVVGQNIKMLMPEPYHSQHDGYLSHYKATGDARIIGTRGREVRAKRKDGSIFPMDLSVSAFQLEGGKHFSGIIRDITARKEAEDRLLLYTKELERSNQELDDFAYIASHDLKEPLRGLHNHVSFLIEDYETKLDADGMRRLTRVSELSERMEHLISDLLYFSRLGRAELAIGNTDPNVFIEEIIQMVEPWLKEQNARILVPERLPNIICDKTRVTEIFRNLISNAIKYNDKSERLVEIGFVPEMQSPHGLVKNVFYVKDNGIGIEPEFFEEIFRIFKRLDTGLSGKQSGTGVGLTFVKKIVERHKGHIWLTSEKSKGTTFYFNLNLGEVNYVADHETALAIHSYGGR